jgi:glutaconate CoA-transferase, subunit B
MSATREEAVRFIALAAREIRDGDVCFVGIGVPSLAAMAAKRHHAPNAVLIYESGAVDADPPVPPLSTGSPSVVANTAMTTSCLDVFAMLQKGAFDRGLLSAAQVDRRGNLNSTSLNRKDKVPLRLVGSGGAHDIALLAREVVIMMPQDRRRFVEAVDFVTSPGARKAGAARGAGPTCLVTPRARFSFAEGELTLEAIADGVEENDAVDCLPWVPPCATARPGTLPPIERGLFDAASRLLDLWNREIA